MGNRVVRWFRAASLGHVIIVFGKGFLAGFQVGLGENSINSVMGLIIKWSVLPVREGLVLRTIRRRRGDVDVEFWRALGRRHAEVR